MPWVPRRCVMAPLVVALAVLVWFTLPLRLIGPPRSRRSCPGGCARRASSGSRIVYLQLRGALLLVVMFGRWFASGFGVEAADGVLRGHPLRPGVQGMMLVFFQRGPAGSCG